MKIIKRERQVRLDELIKHCIDNDTFGSKGVFTSTTGKVNVTVYKDDVVVEDEFYDFNITKTLFTITEEVEITEETELNMVVITNDRECYACTDTSIHCLLSEENVLFEDCCVKFICLQNEDGSTGELIWTKERGLID